MSSESENVDAGGSNSAPVEMSIEQAVALALRFHRTGRWQEAENVYRRVLEVEPDCVDALHFFGVLLCQTGHPQEGAESIARAISLRPGYADAHNNLGNILRAQGQFSQAAAAYRRAIELDPESAQAHNNLGVILRRLGQHDEAAAVLRQSIALDPKCSESHLNLARILEQQGWHEGAIAEYRKAAEVSSGAGPSYDALGRALLKAGRREEAMRVYRVLLQIAPGDPIARHMLAASSGLNVPAQASGEYVQQVFDQFADTFDTVLRSLDYRAPLLVAEATMAELAHRQAQNDVLDAGCGTGLCGVHLRPYARRLVGVDLSARMLAQARDRNLYDDLVQADLTQYLRCNPSCFDLIASADTLVYFGDLSAVLAASAAALRRDGLLVFTLEDAGDSTREEGFRLQAHGRYSHLESYVREVLSQASLKIRYIKRDVLRTESGEPVSGLIVAARSCG